MVIMVSPANHFLTGVARNKGVIGLQRGSTFPIAIIFRAVRLGRKK
jgi:hypothetical protein